MSLKNIHSNVQQIKCGERKIASSLHLFVAIFRTI
jgi:hypothetical protein